MLYLSTNLSLSSSPLPQVPSPCRSPCLSSGSWQPAERSSSSGFPADEHISFRCEEDIPSPSCMCMECTSHDVPFGISSPSIRGCSSSGRRGISTSQACMLTGISASSTAKGAGPRISIEPLLVHAPRAFQNTGDPRVRALAGPLPRSWDDVPAWIFE